MIVVTSVIYLYLATKIKKENMKLNNIRGNKTHRGNRGRPITRPAVLKDGFYLEVRNKSTDPGTGVKIWKPTYAEMLESAAEYRKIKMVVVLGEYKKGNPVSSTAPKKKKTK